MSLIFNFIAIKKLKSDLFLKTVTDSLIKQNIITENLYVSILPPVENLYLVEFADFLPASRYRDFDISIFLVPLSKSFNTVYLFDKNDQSLKSKFQKYTQGNLEREFKGEEALVKGLKFDLIMSYDHIMKHVNKVWFHDHSNKSDEPIVYQLINDRLILNKPIVIDPKDFYGWQNS